MDRRDRQLYQCAYLPALYNRRKRCVNGNIVGAIFRRFAIGIKQHWMSGFHLHVSIKNSIHADQRPKWETITAIEGDM